MCCTRLAGNTGPKKSPKIVILSLIHISEPTRQAEISYAVFCLKKCVCVIMVALCNRADHYIFALLFLSSSSIYLLFFLQKNQKVAKNRHLGTIPQLCRAISSQLRHVSTIGKNLLSSNISSTCPHNMVQFGPLVAEIISLVWSTQVISRGFASSQRYCTAL